MITEMDTAKNECKSYDTDTNDHLKQPAHFGNMVCLKSFLLLSVFLTMFFGVGFPFNMSVLYVELLKEFEQSNSKTSFVQSVCTGFLLILGFPSGLMISKFGTRKIGIAAGFLISIGLTLSYFATSIDYLIVTLGLITGIGASAANIAAPTCIGHWFKGKSRHVALSVNSLGVGIAGILHPVLINVLVNEYKLRGTLLLLGGMTLNIIPFAGLWGNPNLGHSDISNKNKYRTNVKLQSFHNKALDVEETEIDINVDVIGQERQTESNDINRYNQKKTVDTDHSQDSNATIKTSTLRKNISPKKTRKTRFIVFIALRDLLRNKAYSFHLCGLSLAVSALNAMNVMMIDFLEYKGFTRNEAVELYMYMGVSFTVSTVIVGIGKTVPGVSVIMFPIFHTVAAAVALFTLPSTESYLQHALLISCHGFGLGGLVVIRLVGTVKIIGLQNYANGLGLIMTSIGVCTLIAGPVAGGIFDATGSYDLTFYSAGASVSVSIVLFTGVLILRKLSWRSSSESH